MKINDLLDLTLREILEDYCVLYNLECAYYYGITTHDNCEKMYNEYNIEEEYPEAISVESILNYDSLISYDEDLIDYNRIEKIMGNLGISKKE